MKKNICFIKRYSHIFAVISLIISICALIASFRIETFHVGIESVMGLVTALMGICATFMVGWQIFSSINVNKELENIKLANGVLKSKIETLNGLIAEQKEDMTKEREARRLLKKEMTAQLWVSNALSYMNLKYFDSYKCLAQSLCLFLELQKNRKTSIALNLMNKTLDNIEKELQFIEGRKKANKDYDISAFSYSPAKDEEDWLIKSISSNPGFELIRKQVEELEKRRLSSLERVEKLKQ